MKRVVFLSLNLLWTTFVVAQVVNIPDANFKKALVDNPSINTNGDTEIQVSEAVAYTGGINVFNKKIQNLSGIEAFVNLTSLDCSDDFVVFLDVSKNIALTTLFCNNNFIFTLDVSNNLALENLECNNNNLTTIDISKNIVLKTLACNNNNLTTIDVSKNIALTELYCYNTGLTTLNLSKNTKLNILSCSNSNLSTLDVSNNIALTYFVCDRNNLTSLDLSKNLALRSINCRNNILSTLNITKNTALSYIDCRNNSLSALDFSKNTALTFINCSTNALNLLNIKNGVNNKLTLFDATQNLLLNCIEVDNSNFILGNWRKDPTASYSTNCMIPTKDINSEGFLQLYPNPSTDSFSFSNLTEAPLSVAIYDLHGKLVQHYPSPASNYDISTLCNGLYIVKAQFATGEAIAKLVKGE